MYTLKNGIMYEDGKPVIAMGQSYYPSFHEAKYPMPPSGDRIGLMKEDVRWMKDVGFNFLRVAAIGDVTLKEDDTINVQTDFVDEMLRESDRVGLATSVRLQGYVMNLRGYDDYYMVNAQDEKMELNWSAFMRSSLYHPGILKDNRDASQALARHFQDIPGVLSYQIYNEPHYPYNGVFDYHPATLEAYRKWREEKGLEPQEAPRRRPLPGESPDAWIQWRVFNMYAMGKFLNDTSDAVKEAVPEKETYTCMTSAPAGYKIMESGIQYFDNAERMDTVGITSYTQLEGGDYYSAAYQYDMTESAAALYGKHAWTIEIDARTHMPGRKTHEEVYSLLGAGHKGIVFYEWRGDYPDKGTPLPDNCGFIFNDGTKTEHYDKSLEMVSFVNRYSSLFAASEKMRSGVGLLCSDYAAAYADAYKTDLHYNMYVRQSLHMYRELRKAGVTVDLLQARHLKENRLQVKCLFIPFAKEWLSPEETAQIDAFTKAGGKAYYLRELSTFSTPVPYGLWPWGVEAGNTTTVEFRPCLEAEDVLNACRIRPLVEISARTLKYSALEGKDYKLIVLTNTDPLHEKVSGAVLRTALPFSGAQFISPYAEINLEVQDGAIVLPEIDEGGVIVLKD